MNDVKLHDTSLVKSARSATSSPRPKASVVEPQAPRQSKAVEGTPASVSKAVSQQKTVVSQQQQTVVSERQMEAQQKELREAVTRLNDYVQSVQRDLLFELDDSSGKVVVTVMDRQTQEVVRQIPDEIALKLARNLQKDEPLNLFNAKV